MYLMRTVLVTSFMALALAADGLCQSTEVAPAKGSAHHVKENTPTEAGGTPTTKRRTLSPEQKLKLLSVGAVNPSEFSQSFPVKTQSSNQKPESNELKRHQADASGVAEFQAVSQAPDSPAGALVLRPEGSKKSALKKIHGEVDGALASGIVGGNQVGAAVGATSKSGKTSIFVQTNHATIQEPH
jgi:hypothetical protein